MAFNRLISMPIILDRESLVKALRSSLLQSLSDMTAGIRRYLYADMAQRS